MQIVGIIGKAGVGKDTMADWLVSTQNFVKMSLADPLKRICKDVFDFSDQQLYGPSAERNKPDHRYPRGEGHVCFSCADAFYSDHAIKFCRETGGHTTCFYCSKSIWSSDTIFATCYLTPRIALQTLGTEWGRAMYQSVWVENLIRNSKMVLEGGRGYSQQQGVLSHGSFSGVVAADVRFINEVKAIIEVGGVVVRVRRRVKEMTGGISGHASEMEQDGIKDSDLNGGVIEAPEGLMPYSETIDKWMTDRRKV